MPQLRAGSSLAWAVDSSHFRRNEQLAQATTESFVRGLLRHGWVRGPLARKTIRRRMRASLGPPAHRGDQRRSHLSYPACPCVVGRGAASDTMPVDLLIA